MAEDRTNMVSLIDIGSWLGGKSANIVEMGDGFTELTEDWGPDVESTQYVNMKAKAYKKGLTYGNLMIFIP